MRSIMEDGEGIELVITYRIRPKVPLFSFDGYTMMQRVKTRGFVGAGRAGERENDKQKNEDAGKEEEEKSYVYITENGTVYHESKDCTHIKLSIRGAMLSQMDILRNEQGGRYKQCEICQRTGGAESEIYITKDGDRYHQNLNCSGLKRTVSAIPRKEAAGRRACSRCIKG